MPRRNLGMWMEQEWRWPNFTLHEMACRGTDCQGTGVGCGTCEMVPAFMDLLQQIRNEYGKPMIVTSGYRCPAHNAKVSTTGKNGPHVLGEAVDIKVYGRDAHRLIKIAIAYGMTGIGVKQHGPHDGRFVHLDTLQGETRPWIWSY